MPFFLHYFPFDLYQLAFVGKIGFRCRGQWHRLRNKILFSSGLGVIVRPPVNGGNLTGPVSMSRIDRGSPFQGIGKPRVLSGLSSSVHTVEEVEHEDKLCGKGDNSRGRYEHVQIGKLIGKVKIGKAIIPSWKPGYTNIVHGEKHQINSDEANPEVDVPKPSIHHSSKHLRKPMINTGQHSEERG